jgi:hypothetical protein
MFIVKRGDVYEYEDGFKVRDFPDIYATDWEIYKVGEKIEAPIFVSQAGTFILSYKKDLSETLPHRLFRGGLEENSLVMSPTECCPKCILVSDLSGLRLAQVFCCDHSPDTRQTIS